MNSELLATLEYIEQERGISRDQLVGALEAAILSASKKSIHPAINANKNLHHRSGRRIISIIRAPAIKIP